MRHTILIVDDERDMIALLRDNFAMLGYLVLTAGNYDEAVKKAACGPDVILLDVNMPGRDGLSVCRAIRQFVRCPIVFLTARVSDADKIEGFAAGGDDYVTKPFSLDELNARVAAHLRREERPRRQARVYFAGDVAVDYLERAVYVRGERLPLAKKEFEIIELLSQNRGQVFDKERIYERVWGWDSEGSSSVVAEHIKRIRAKFAQAGAPGQIETVWGVGYKWVK
ncbi:MAG TPA: response regulator transcription factor [Candidatus Pullichristensenella avicola]|nr:response regulator transcription factor [Candidatus Pullichristensenella avicola]